MDKVKEAAASTASAPAAAAGLRGVVAATTSIGDVNGEKGELIYQGINIHDLARYSTFEEVVFLLWNGRLPKRAELDDLKRNIAANYELQPELLALMREFPRDAEPMDTLRTAISALAFYDKNAKDISREAAIRTATRLVGQFPTIVATLARLRLGQEPVAPRRPSPRRRELSNRIGETKILSFAAGWGSSTRSPTWAACSDRPSWARSRLPPAVSRSACW